MDGGIPATKSGDPSGCWTTGEALEFFLLSPHFPKEKLPETKEMIEFLLETQLPSGGWPLVVSNTTVSTMTTGHAVAALAISNRIFSYDSQLVDKINESIDKALGWLRQYQNRDGGWGVEPETSYGKESRMISTFYALHGFFGYGLTVDSSKNVREGINYINSVVNKDGGWGGKRGLESGSSNTARALIALIQSGQYNKDSVLIKRGLKFILKQKDSWKAYTETYVTSGATGETVFNANTPYDVLEALIRLGYFGDEVKNLTLWFIDSQEDDGSWYISSNSKESRPICTWPTSEAISVLDIAQKYHIKNVFQTSDKRLTSRWKPMVAFLIIANIAQLIYILEVHIKISTFWNSLPEPKKQFILQLIAFGVISALIVSIAANLITPTIRNVFHNIKDYLFKKNKKY